VTAWASVPGSRVEVGSATAYILDRFAMSDANVDFIDLDRISETAARLAQDPVLFDNCSEEIFLVFHEVSVEPESRWKGLGHRE
jgi:hypothetical protein